MGSPLGHWDVWVIRYALIWLPEASQEYQSSNHLSFKANFVSAQRQYVISCIPFDTTLMLPMMVMTSHLFKSFVFNH